jgi:hypothetical protein
LQEEGVRENRRMFISMCNEMQGKVINTFFEKPDTKLITHKHAGTELGPPWTRGRYETLDYFIVADRWKNSVTDMESDMLANVDTDHGPVQGTAKVKLKVISRVGK